MSTRCQVEFVYKNSYKHNGKLKKVVEKVLCYRHSDGYPDAVVPEMIRFLKWNRGRNTDLEYLVALTGYISKRKILKGMLQMTIQIITREYQYGLLMKTSILLTPGTVQLGYGICQPKSLHGDIEYFYRVTIDPISKSDTYLIVVEITIEVYETEFNLKYKDLEKKKPLYTLKFDDQMNPKGNTSLVLAKITREEN